jgi:hypothetical protein
MYINATKMRNVTIAFAMSIFFISCDRNEKEAPEPLEYGYLSLNLSLTITSEPTNGRTLAVNTADFRVTIFAADGTEVMVFDPFSTAPAEVSLPTGEYYVEAHSNNLVDAAFENPYYFGRSDNFTIDKEELKSIDIEAELANTKVAINYSANVVNTFHSYTGTVTVVSSGASLFYAQGETREGYFLTSPLDVEVNLSYTKLDGSTIERTFTASIADPQPRTLYNINVDATLEDGKVVFNITVDEGFDTVNIELGDLTGGGWINVLGGSGEEYARGLTQTSDGGYIVMSNSNSADGDIGVNKGENDYWIVKFDGNGSKVWGSVLGGSSIEEAHEIVESTDGAYYAIGTSFSNDGDVAGGASQIGAWIVKLDQGGNPIWQKKYNGTGGGFAYAGAATSDGGLVVTGYQFASGASLVWVFKMDDAGNIEWEHVYGGSASDIGSGITTTSDGGYLVIGPTLSSDGDITGQHGGFDYSLYKLDAGGVLQWQKCLGGSGDDFGMAVIEASGGYVVAGSSRSTDGDVTGLHGGQPDVWVVKVDFTGDIIWQRMLGGSAGENAGGMLVAPDGNIVVSGIANSTDGDIGTFEYKAGQIWLLKLDNSNGSLLWNRTYGGSGYEYATGVCLGHDGGYVMSGYTNSSDDIISSNAGLNDLFIMKVDDQGNF